MKLTIEIPDAHTGDLLQFLTILSAQHVEASPDPAPGHPELFSPVWNGIGEPGSMVPLGLLGKAVQMGKSESLAKWAESVATTPGIDAADPLKVAMDDPVEDTRPPIVPQVGMQFFTRNGDLAKVESKDERGFHGVIKVDDKWLNYHWNFEGRSKSRYRPLDIVEPTPF